MQEDKVDIKKSEQGKKSLFEKIFNILTFSTVIFGMLTFFMNYKISLRYESFYEVPYEYFLIHNVYLNKLFTFLCTILIFVSLSLFFYLDIDEYEKEKKHVKLLLIILIIVLIILSLAISYSFTGINVYLILLIMLALLPLIINLFNKSNIAKVIIYTSASVLLIINILNYLYPSFSDPSTKNEYEILELKDANNKKENDNHIETYLVKISEKNGKFVVIDGKICNGSKTLKLKKGSYKLVDPTKFTITYKKFENVDSLNQVEFDKNK